MPALLRRLLLLFGFAIFLFGCQDSNSSKSNSDNVSAEDPAPATSAIGVLLDSAVAGVTYTTSGGAGGLTNEEGEFLYNAGETVAFQLGGIDLGTAAGGETLTPVDLAGARDTADATVVNIARLLQSLDSDQDPSNGILISAVTRRALAQSSLSVRLPIEDFASQASQAFTAASLNVSLVSADAALTHLHTSLAQAGLSSVVASEEALDEVLPADVSAIENQTDTTPEDTSTATNEEALDEVLPADVSAIDNQTDTTPEDTTTAPTFADCAINGQTVVNGDTITTYATETVPFGQSCLAETRICSDGTLSGSYPYLACAVEEPSDCVWNETTIPSGSSVIAYAAEAVPFGQGCLAESRVCNNGQLSGSYAFATCAVAEPQSCTFDGQTIAHGDAITAYASASVAPDETCNSETRLCSDGTLSGSFSASTCVVEPATNTDLASNEGSQLTVQSLLQRSAGTFTVPDNATSFLLSAFATQGTPRILSLTSPSGREELAYLDSKAEGISSYVVGNYDNYLVPMRPDILPEAGVWSYVIDGATAVELSLRTDSGAVRAPELRIQPYVSTTPPSDLATALDAVAELYAQNGLTVEVASPITLSSQYAVLPASFSNSATALLLEQGRADAVNLFLIDDFQSGGILGVAAGIPGSLGIPSAYNGVLVSLSAHQRGFFSQTLDTQLLAETIVHEAGHLLGLWHPTESSGLYFDPLDDTPECSVSQFDSNRDDEVSASECVGQGAENLMFWTSWSGGQSTFTADQRLILQRSPLAFQGSLTTQTTDDIALSYASELNETIQSNPTTIQDIRTFVEETAACRRSTTPQTIDVILAQGCMEFQQRHYRPADLPANLDGLSTPAEYVAVVNQSDRFSYYFEPASYAETTQSLSGARSYIGFRYAIRDSSAPVSDLNPYVIESVFPYTRAWWDGIQAGDLLIAIDGTSVNGLTVAEVGNLLPTAEAEAVTLTLGRGSLTQSIQTASETHLSRRVGASDQIAYLNVREYTTVSADRVREDLNALVADGSAPAALILDLRQNGGGSLLGAVQLSDYLANASVDGNILFTLQTQRESTAYGFGWNYGDNAGNYSANNFVILTDSGSASASELTAAALKDVGLVTILGGTTYGKGVGQNVVDLLDGSGVFITSFELLSPSGSSWHETGVSPTYALDTTTPTSPDQDALLQAAVAFLETGSVSRTPAITKQTRRDAATIPVSYTTPWDGGTRERLQ